MTPPRKYLDEARFIAAEWSSLSKEFARSSDLTASSFAQLTVQSLILMHGGALIAIPTWWPAIHSHANHSSPTLVFAILPFIVGLPAAVMAAALGFHSLAVRASAYERYANEAQQRNWIHFYQVERLDASPEAVKFLEDQKLLAEQTASLEFNFAELLWKRFSRFKLAAICLAWFSLAMFVFGSGLTVMSAIQRSI